MPGTWTLSRELSSALAPSSWIRLVLPLLEFELDEDDEEDEEDVLLFEEADWVPDSDDPSSTLTSLALEITFDLE